MSRVAVLSEEPGDYVAPEALALVHTDLDTDRGSYVEPAIWMQHA